jgi:phosphate transport system protein
MWNQILKLWHSDNLLDQSWELSNQMFDISHEMFHESVRALREADHDKIDKEIRNKDIIINKYEREVRRNVLTHLAVHGSEDIPAGLVLIIVIIDIERIGDYTKNIVELVEAHGKTLDAGKYEKKLKKIEEAVQYVFDQTKSCLTESEKSIAMKLLLDYQWVNAECDKNLRKIIKQKDKNMDSGTAATLAMYMRYLKRIHSHLRNILTSVVNPFDRIGYKPKSTEELS